MQISKAAKRLVGKLRVIMYADESRYVESSALVEIQKTIDEATAAQAAEIERLRNQLELLLGSCRIAFYPNGIDPMRDAYPVEHYMSNGCKKNNRSEIETYSNDAAGVEGE